MKRKKPTRTAFLLVSVCAALASAPAMIARFDEMRSGVSSDPLDVLQRLTGAGGDAESMPRLTAGDQSLLSEEMNALYEEALRGAPIPLDAPADDDRKAPPVGAKQPPKVLPEDGPPER